MSEQVELLAIRGDAAASDSDEVCPDRSGTVNNPEVPKTTEQKYQTYHRRWYMLFSLSLLSLSNGMMWLTYAPIPNETAAFYDITLNQVDMFSISYFIVSLLIGFIAIWLIEKTGLRFAVLFGALMNFLGASLRVVSTIDAIRHDGHHLGYIVAMIGQVCTAVGQPFFLYSPTKLSASWFSEQQRAVSTMFASMANPIGIGVIYVLAPNIVGSEPTQQIPKLLWVCAILAASGFVLSWAWLLLGSKPPTPPSPSADDYKEPFLKGLKHVACTRTFWILLIVWGIGSGLFNALLTLLPQFLCSYGYSAKYTGTWGGVMVFVGLVGAFVVGVVIDLTKKFEEVAKVMFAIALICFIWFAEVFKLEDQPVLIAFSLCSFGFFAFSIMPVFLELGVELTYPADEAVSSGLLWSATQIMGLISTLIGQALETDLPEGQENKTKCYGNIKPKNLTYTGLFLAAVGVSGYVILVAGLRHPKYKRLEAEKSKSDSDNPT